METNLTQVWEAKDIGILQAEEVEHWLEILVSPRPKETAFAELKQFPDEHFLPLVIEKQRLVAKKV